MPPVAKEKLRADEFAKRLGKSEGIAMGKIFALAKEFIDMPPAEIEKLLDSKHHAMRVGAVSIMDWKARAKQPPMPSANNCSIFTSGVMTKLIRGTW